MQPTQQLRDRFRAFPPDDPPPPSLRFRFFSTAALIWALEFFAAAKVDAELSIPLPTVFPLPVVEETLIELRAELKRREWQGVS